MCYLNCQAEVTRLRIDMESKDDQFQTFWKVVTETRESPYAADHGRPLLTYKPGTVVEAEIVREFAVSLGDPFYSASGVYVFLRHSTAVRTRDELEKKSSRRFLILQILAHADDLIGTDGRQASFRKVFVPEASS